MIKVYKIKTEKEMVNREELFFLKLFYTIAPGLRTDMMRLQI